MIQLYSVFFFFIFSWNLCLTITKQRTKDQVWQNGVSPLNLIFFLPLLVFIRIFQSKMKKWVKIIGENIPIWKPCARPTFSTCRHVLDGLLVISDINQERHLPYSYLSHFLSSSVPPSSSRPFPFLLERKFRGRNWFILSNFHVVGEIVWKCFTTRLVNLSYLELFLMNTLLKKWRVEWIIEQSCLLKLKDAIVLFVILEYS